MEFLGYDVKIQPRKVLRQNKENRPVMCEGFLIEIFDKSEPDMPVDVIEAAVDFELLENSLEEAEQLAKDYIGSEKKGLRKIVNEFHSSENL